MTHTYLTYTFSLINTDGRNAAVDPHWGGVIHQTLTSSPLSPGPYRKGLVGTKLESMGVTPPCPTVSFCGGVTITLTERMLDNMLEVTTSGSLHLHPIPSVVHM